MIPSIYLRLTLKLSKYCALNYLSSQYPYYLPLPPDSEAADKLVLQELTRLAEKITNQSECKSLLLSSYTTNFTNNSRHNIAYHRVKALPSARTSLHSEPRSFMMHNALLKENVSPLKNDLAHLQCPSRFSGLVFVSDGSLSNNMPTTDDGVGEDAALTNVMPVQNSLPHIVALNSNRLVPGAAVAPDGLRPTSASLPFLLDSLT